MKKRDDKNTEYNLTLSDLAHKAEVKDFTLTEQEAINVWLLIPEGCERDVKTKYNNRGFNAIVEHETLIVKGLGEFKIIK